MRNKQTGHKFGQWNTNEDKKEYMDLIDQRDGSRTIDCELLSAINGRTVFAPG